MGVVLCSKDPIQVLTQNYLSSVKLILQHAINLKRRALSLRGILYIFFGPHPEYNHMVELSTCIAAASTTEQLLLP